MSLFSVNDTEVLCNARHSEAGDVGESVFNLPVLYRLRLPALFCAVSLSDALKIENFVLVFYRRGHTRSLSEHGS